MFKRGVYTRASFFVASLLCITMIAGSVLAADVAYIYRKDFKIDQNVLNVFKDMSMTVDMINEKNLLKTNLAQYRIVFVGDENLIYPNNIPVGEIPLIVMSYHHGNLFGFTDRDGISQLGSTAPLNVKTSVNKGATSVPIYTQAFERGRIAVPYYFLDNENKADNLITIASTTPTSSGKNFGDVVSLVQPGTILSNGIQTKDEMCFFGIIHSNYWTPEARQMFEECAEYVASECQKNSDCPTPFISSDPFCLANDIFQTETAFTCVKNGFRGQCVPYDVDLLNEECAYACTQGNCARCDENLDCNDGNVRTEDICVNSGNINASCENLPIECFSDSECGTDGLIGNLFCTEDITVTQLYQTFTCSNPGTGASSCSSKTTPQVNETCEDICVDGGCEFFICESDLECDDENVATEDNCLNPSTLSSVCENLPIECFSKVDCGEDGYIGEPTCSENEIVQEYETFTCSNPGTAQSECSSVKEDKTTETCEDACVSGSCKSFACESDSECQDNKTSTQDICKNPGTLNSFCENLPITCFSNSECGTDGLIGEAFCTENITVAQLYQTFTCSNPGTFTSLCSSNTTSQSIETCEDICINGACATFDCESNSDCDDNNTKTQDTCLSPGTLESSCANEPILCFVNSDCGVDGLIGDLFCSDNLTAAQLYQTFTCSNPGTSSSACSSNTTQRLNETCEDICVAGSCKLFACELDIECNDTNSSTFDTCHNQSTLESYCTHEQISCFSNSDCGANELIGEPFCLGGNVAQVMKMYTCTLPGTASSACSSQEINSTTTICPNNCENAQCIQSY